MAARMEARGAFEDDMSQIQTSMFDEPIPAYLKICTPPPEARKLARASDPITSHEAAREVVESGSAKSHCQQILELLMLRTVTSLELSKISLKYTSRLSDLKAAGHDIVCKPTISHATGKKVWYYKLVTKDADE